MSNQIVNGGTGVPPVQHSAATCLIIARTILAFAAAIAITALLTTRALAWNETILYSFAGPPDGYTPAFSLSEDAAGNFYGMTVWGGAYGGGTAFELSLQDGVWVETILHSFGGPGDQVGTSGPLVMDRSGNLYGAGAYFTGVGVGYGVVYELSPDGHGNWKETVLYTFKENSYTNGSLTLDAAGRLYGGGSGSNCCGFVFSLSPPAKKAKKWTYKVLYNFKGPKHDDGEYPSGSFIFDAAGNLYGTTRGLGQPHNYGTAFELSPGTKMWTEKVLYSFGGFPDGQDPEPGLIFDSAGNLYGTTVSGGSAGLGTVFELSPNRGNWAETLLYSFTSGSDGWGPAGPVTFYNSDLVGATACGGSGTGCGGAGGNGVVFLLSPSGGGWTEQVLHTFTSSPDGSIPQSGLSLDSSGNLYGVTGGGGIVNSNCGSSGCGIVYEISP